MIVPYRTTLTTAGGQASGNTDDLRGLLKFIYVKPATSTTSYDLRLTDEDGDLIYETKGFVGTVREEMERPIKGVYTVAILNASANEAFIIKLMVQEIPS